MTDASAKPKQATSAASGPWTDKRVAMLKDMWCIQGLSSAQIASRLGNGITREAVCGKVNRLGMKKSTVVTPRKRPVKINTGNGGTKSKAPLISPDFVMPRAQDYDVARKRLVELGPDDCRFPVDMPVGFGFCGLERAPGVSYCEVHRDRCIVPVPVKAGHKAPANDEREKADA